MIATAYPSRLALSCPMLRGLSILLAFPILAAAQEKTTFDDHIFPLFQQSCLNCHNPDKAKGGLDLSTYAATLKGGSGGKIVEPGDIASKIVTVVLQTAEPKMPPEGDKLASSSIDLLKHWIQGGLLENKSSSARKPAKPKFETALRSDPASKPEGPPPMPEHLLLEPAVLTPRPAAIHALATSPWAPLLAVTGQRQILLHHTGTLELVGVLPFPEGDPVSLAFTPDGRYLIVGGGIPGKSGLTVTFDVTTGARLLSAAKEFDSILAADIRPGFDIVATGGPSKLLKIWNTSTGELVKSVKKHTDWITALDLSPDGVLLASGDRNGGVWVWESESASEFHTLRAHQAAITATVFRADSNLLATASEDGTVRYWEMNGGSEVKKIDAHPGGVTALAFARDGSTLTAGRDMKAKLWKPDFNHARDIVQGLPALPTAVAFDHEGTRAFIADALGTIRAYQTADAKPVGEILANPPSIETRLTQIEADVTAKETLLATATQDTTSKTDAREKARQDLAEATKAHQQAIGIHKAAQAGVGQSPGDMSAKIAADALARIQPAEQAIVRCKTTLEATEKAAAESTAATESAKAALASIQSTARHWQAAAINTRALVTAREAETTALTLEDAQLTFSTASADLTKAAERLNARREEREQLQHLAANLPAPVSAATAVELQATFAALDIRISQAEEDYQQAGQQMLQLKVGIEETAPVVIAKKQEAVSLKHSYQAAIR